MYVGNKLRLATALAGAALGAFVTSVTWATTALTPLGIPELTQRSELVVHGTVETISSILEENRIFTHLDVRVSEAWKGEPAGETVRLKLYGGSYNGIRTMMIGAACMAVNEETVLFLVPNGPGTYNVVSLAEGKFEVVRTDSQATVRRDLRGIAFMDPVGPEIPESFAELEAAVRAAAR